MVHCWKSSQLMYELLYIDHTKGQRVVEDPLPLCVAEISTNIILKLNSMKTYKRKQNFFSVFEYSKLNIAGCLLTN